ncbi:MAG: inositol-3-phosphate synthase [Planctomycetota bacterium]|nr:inositol-3-phosphate synthase [Planctomycetota bacterium]
MSKDINQTGLFLVGVRGAIGTTIVHGIEAIRGGMPKVGLVTEIDGLNECDWAAVESFVVTGWDVCGNAHDAAETLVRTRVLPRDVVDMAGGVRDRLEMSIAAGVPEPEDDGGVDHKSADMLALSLPDVLSQLREDIRNWKSSERLRRGAVVYLASAERERELLPPDWYDSDADPIELLKTAPRDLSRSVLYALAAICEGVPFINFTPAPGAALPAIAGFARRQGVAVLGNDGKTGETLLKTSLAPMFRDRNLNVMAWEGYNMLGNKDGAALEDPQRAKAKLQNKDVVLPSILPDNPMMHSGVSIDFVPSLHDWKTAMDFVHFEGFLGAQMSLQFTWQGSDSALAAPLVLDLVRIALRAQERGEGGPVHAASAFFKSPLEMEEHDFFRQMSFLREWAVRD